MRHATWTILAVVCCVSPAGADWYPGDGHKMHFPQLPDPNGWDVRFPGTGLADDWQCSRTGPVTDIHLWYSWQSDVVFPLEEAVVTIYEDDEGGDYSRPGFPLWQQTFGPNEMTTRLAGQGDQGWYDTDAGVWEHDHTDYCQLNIENIADPFVQQQGEFYWLGVMLNSSGDRPGWKTADVDSYPAPYTGNHYEDAAVYWGFTTSGWDWQRLRDPITIEWLDLAFVLTSVPEPSTLMLAVGLFGLVATRLGRRRK